MGLVTVCWAVWKASNPRLFYKKPIYSLGEILYSSYLFMKYWASLYPEDKQQMIKYRCGEASWQEMGEGPDMYYYDVFP
jgi:hypothetical protein